MDALSQAKSSQGGILSILLNKYPNGFMMFPNGKLTIACFIDINTVNVSFATKLAFSLLNEVLAVLVVDENGECNFGPANELRNRKISAQQQ